MKPTTQRQVISAEQLKNLLHKNEESRFDLALLAVIVALSAALIWALVMVWAGIVLVFLGVLFGTVWLGVRVARAALTANAVKVSDKNFPQIHRTLNEVQDMLDYKLPIEVYIIEEGTVNAFLAKFFGTRYIILHSELVRNMLEKDEMLQLKWVIGRFVGALKAKHTRLDALRIIIDAIEKLKIFNILILPYERAIQYSGDQIGLAVCGNLEQALLAFQKLLVGNHLAPFVDFRGVLDQRREMGFFAWLARLSARHPHTIDRFINLLIFAQQKFPDQYTSYITSRTAIKEETL